MSRNEIHSEGREIAEEPMADVEPPERVLQIPELLELICMHLPVLDLLVYQRVNKKWQSTIQCSGSLQEKLCFKWRTAVKNEDGFPPFDPPLSAWNPLLFKFGTIGHASWYLEVETLRAMDYDGASWKEMFVVNLIDYPILVERGPHFRILNE